MSEELRQGVRWPDDPQRKLEGKRATVNFGAAFKAVSYCMNGGVHEAGLLCASHFGDLQFLHSMASTSSETTEVTRSKILDWARFSYDYAVGRLNDSDVLCEKAEGYPTISEALVGSKEPG